MARPIFYEVVLEQTMSNMKFKFIGVMKGLQSRTGVALLKDIGYILLRLTATPRELPKHQTVRKQENSIVGRRSDVGKPFYVDVTAIQQESNLKSAPRLKLTKSDRIDSCEDLKGMFVSRNHIFRKGTNRKLQVHAGARKKEISKGYESKHLMHSFAMETNVSFCDTAIHFFKKIAVVDFSNKSGSEPLLAWKRATWVQETCLLIQATLLRTALFYFHRGLRKYFAEQTLILGLARQCAAARCW